MKRFTLIALAALLVAGSAIADTVHGSWTASSDKPGKLYVNISRRHSNNGSTYDIGAFSGLTDQQVRTNAATPVTFALQREAGTIAFEGTFKDGYGGGQFTFTPNPAYLSTLRSMGLDPNDVIDRKETPDEALLQLAALDVSTSFIRSMQAEGYREDLDKYVAMRIFRVTPDLIREFRQLGYDKLDADDLVASQIHGVTPQYVREMRASGRGTMSMDDLVATRIHGATPEFAAEMKSLGLGDLSNDDLVAFRIHGVTADFIRRMRELGYNNLSGDDLVAFRIHGVKPDFIEELKELGYSNVPGDDLVAMRIHGVTTKFIRELRDAGYTGIPIDKLVEMKIHGIDATFVKRMNKQ